MSEPLISVVIPAYNCAGVIGRAIDSALAQKVALEILVLDDGSSDGLEAVMAGYEGNEAVRFAKNEKNLGAAATRNRGVTLARGKYVAFLDADDYWTEDKLVRQLALIEQTGCVLCCTARELMTPEGELTGKVIPVKEKISYRELLKHNSINCSSVLILTDVAREFPMHHEESHEDYIMWLEVLQKYGSACAINEPLLKYRLSNTGKSGSKLQSAKMTFGVYRCMGFGLCRSMLLFAGYAFHGVKKYALSYLGEKHET